MKIEQVASKRSWLNFYAYDLVYEWEDVFCKMMEVPIYNERSIAFNRYFKLTPWISSLFQTNKFTLEFEMECIASHWFTNRKKNIIPFIVDYYPQPKGPYGISMFNFLYKLHPVVFVSSMEVYEYLKSLGEKIKVNIEHVALSLPDKYKIMPQTCFKKEYDLILMGRQSKVFMEFLEKYKLSHPDLNYVYNKRVDGHLYYYTSDGKLLDDINTRDKYMSLMKKAKCAFYTTPGIDSEKITYGFNQITPRFLELLSCGCHVLARYKDNADARYFEIGKFSKCIETYEEFEQALDYGRNHEVDLHMYSDYLNNHYTSRRVVEVKKILERI